MFKKLKPYLIWPSTIGTYHVRPLPLRLGNAPSIGQSLYIGMFLILNIVLTSVNFQSRQPNAWYSNTWHEIMAYVLYRTGAFAYIMAPLVWLFALRNNLLLWLTSWSHSTFMVLHRWVARIFTLQVVLHSIVSVVLYGVEGTYDTEVKAPYWIWGIVGTVCCVIITFGSGLFVRSYSYEVFLIKHIVFSPHPGSRVLVPRLRLIQVPWRVRELDFCHCSYLDTGSRGASPAHSTGWSAQSQSHSTQQRVRPYRYPGHPLGFGSR